jgi:hypothetical protein
MAARPTARLSPKDTRGTSEVTNSRPSRQCDGCDGVCQAFSNPDTVQRLLQRDVVQIYSGTVASMQQNARQGCELSRLLENMRSFSKVDVVFSAQKVRTAGFGSGTLRVVAVFEGDRRGQLGSKQLEVVTRSGTKCELARSAVIPASSVVDDPAATFVPGRLVDSDPASARTLLVMDSWLASCISGIGEHENCPR